MIQKLLHNISYIIFSDRMLHVQYMDKRFLKNHCDDNVKISLQVRIHEATKQNSIAFSILLN